MRFDSQIAFVTSAGSGIDLGTAHHSAREQTEAIAADLDEAPRAAVAGLDLLVST